MGLTIVTFLAFTIAVAVITTMLSKGSSDTADGYFLAGRGLSAGVIASSMVLTSLSTEQLVGTNASSYVANFSIMAFTVTAIIPLVVLALYLLPRYLKGGFTTVPEFFEERYDAETRRFTSVLFLLGYTFTIIPGALYSGAVAFTQIFNVSELFGISENLALWLVIWIIGIIGGFYAIFGGLKGVAISDTINGVGLFIGALLIPIFGLIFLGSGSFTEGFNIILTQHPEKLNAIGAATDPVPWGTIFTGIIVVQFFYWSTNQAIVQRSLAAKDLKAGQKGILGAGLLLLLLPLILNLPGTISFAIFGDGLGNIDFAYPTLVAKILPKGLLGLFTAVIFGSILSTFNSFVNSAATLFTLDIYKPKINPDISDEKLIKVAKIAGTVVALISMFIAPFLQYGTGGLFIVLKRFAGFFNIPIVALVLVGFANKTVSGVAARITMLTHIILYFLLVWVIKVPINFNHVMGALFVFDILLMFALSLKFKKDKPYKAGSKNLSGVNLKYWKYSVFIGALLIFSLFYVYALLSPIGIASATPNYPKFFKFSIAYWLITFAISVGLHIWFNKTRADIIDQN